MCDPISASIALTVVSGAFSAYSSIKQGQAQADAANYSAQVARNNQVLADRAAADAIDRGNVAADQKASQVRQLIGKQRASLAANGVDVNSGSAVDITTDTAGFGTLDVLTARANAEREALGYKTQGMNYQNQAQLDEMKASSALDAAPLSAAGSLLSTGGSVAKQWYSFNNPYTPYFGGGAP